MAVSKDSSYLGKASDFYEEISEVCQPCSFVGKRLQADRYCVDCRVYMCKKCQEHHKALPLTRNHVLVTNEDAKKAKPVTTNDKCSYKCPNHKQKSINYFCVSHSYLGCSVCMTMEHGQCQTKEYIPKVAEDIRNYDGFKKFDANLNTLETACKASLADVENNLKRIGTDERQMKEAITEFRKKLNSAVDKFENELTAQARQIKINETKKLNVMSKELSASLANVETLTKQVEKLLSSGKNCDTYVLMKKEASHLVALDDEIVNTTNDKTFQRYTFQPNNDLLKVGAIGKLSCRTETVSLCSVKVISSSSADVPAKKTVKASSSSANVPAKKAVKAFSPSADVPAKKAVKASSPSAVDPPKSGQIQPGSRVGSFLWGDQCRGTVEHYDSRRGEWKVNWADGESDYWPASVLEIL